MADEHEEHPAGVFLKLSPAKQESLEKLFEIQPDLSKIVEGKRAWAIIGDILKKIAIFLTTISGGFLVLREVLKALHG